MSQAIAPVSVPRDQSISLLYRIEKANDDPHQTKHTTSLQAESDPPGSQPQSDAHIPSDPQALATAQDHLADKTHSSARGNGSQTTSNKETPLASSGQALV
jgi:hypothetical protein